MITVFRARPVEWGACFFIAAGNVVAATDSAVGARAFQQCAACHSVKRNEHLTGPSLANIWKQKAGSNKSFPRYSDALKNSKVVWDEHTLDLWLTDPQRVIPGNNMVFPGIKDGIARAHVIQYLKAASDGKAPAAGAQQGGMMGRAERPYLKKAALDAQVASLTHCRDTYTLKTVKGAARKIWEFNLRLKTDSSEYGPSPGKPVMTGSGMMGDRASVVFSSPAEISGFIKESCE